MGFLYPGLNMELHYRVDQLDDFLVKTTGEAAKKFYPIGASPELYYASSPILQMREVAMMIFMDKITDKERWHEKVLDEDIVAKWKHEAMEMPEKGLYERIMWEKQTSKIPFPDQGRIMSEAAFDYCIAELRDKARYFQKTDLIPALDSAANAVIKSDTVISKSLHQQLAHAFETLKADQKGSEDWHPGSNEMQLNLIHPSMYPLIWGRSTYFQEEIVGTQDAVTLSGKGQRTPEHQAVKRVDPVMRRYQGDYSIGSGKVPFDLWSSNYQWLPSTMSLEDGKPKFTSYINNLDPKKFPEIYATLESLVDAILPAWDQCLQESQIMRRGGKEGTCSRAGRQNTRFKEIKGGSDSDDNKWVPFDLEHWKKSDAELANHQLQQLNEDCFEEKYGLDACMSREEQEEFYRCEKTGERLPTPYVTEEALAKGKWEVHRTPIYPEPGKYRPVDYTPTRSIRDMFKEHGLQIIVKMASVELTPEKPEFPGGSWHIEGQMNEQICATALYYVDCENVTTSKLAFRMSTDSYFSDKMSYPQDEYNWLEKIYGVALGNSGGLPDACLQTYGDVETRQGRVLAFPNVFQHRVLPFGLEDKKKPGHRRFIALWLIDPHQRILSTANVPPQQGPWWDSYMSKGPIRPARETPDSVMAVEQAREHRKKLMEERTYMVKSHEDGWTRPEYNFCEH